MSLSKPVLLLLVLGGGGAWCLGTRGGAAGRVTTRVAVIVGRSGAKGAWGVALTPCDRSRREALIGERLLSIAQAVGRVATMDCTVASWVVTVSSCLVIDARALSEEQRNGMRMDSLLDRSLSCLSP